MEGASEEENQNKVEANNDNNMSNNGGNKVNSSNEGQSKPKRQMKTPFQLETLEKAYTCMKQNPNSWFFKFGFLFG